MVGNYHDYHYFYVIYGTTLNGMSKEWSSSRDIEWEVSRNKAAVGKIVDFYFAVIISYTVSTCPQGFPFPCRASIYIHTIASQPRNNTDHTPSPFPKTARAANKEADGQEKGGILLEEWKLVIREAGFIFEWQVQSHPELLYQRAGASHKQI